MRTNTWVKLGFLLALSVLGSYIKLGPSSIAFDAMSGFVAALLMGPAAGALICGLGHVAVAAATGFPLTLPFHLAVAAAMAGVGALGGMAARRFGLLAGAAAVVVANGLLAPALLALSDDGAPGYDHTVAAALAGLGAPSFACTPDLFPDLMAAAINRQDIGQWAAAREIETARGR